MCFLVRNTDGWVVDGDDEAGVDSRLGGAVVVVELDMVAGSRRIPWQQKLPIPLLRVPNNICPLPSGRFKIATTASS